jgi:hypothetical protein
LPAPGVPLDQKPDTFGAYRVVAPAGENVALLAALLLFNHR